MYTILRRACTQAHAPTHDACLTSTQQLTSRHIKLHLFTTRLRRHLNKSLSVFFCSISKVVMGSHTKKKIKFKLKHKEKAKVLIKRR